MSVRSRMTHRASIVRFVLEDPFDTFNFPTPVEEVIYGGAESLSLPCYVQGQSQRSVTEEGKFFALTVFLGLFPRDADIQDEDIIVRVSDRRGNAVFEGLRVESLTPRETHFEAVLENYGSALPSLITAGGLLLESGGNLQLEGLGALLLEDA